jgi:hypothetical protein
MASVGYLIAQLALGELPWCYCKSNEEITQMKKSNILETKLSSFPELVAYINAFAKTKTDKVDYKKWIKYFSDLATKQNPSIRYNILPFINKRNEVVSRRITSTDKLPKKETTLMKVSAGNSTTPSKAKKQKSYATNVTSLDKLTKKEVIPKKVSTGNSTTLSKARKQIASNVNDSFLLNEINRRIQPARACKKMNYTIS